MLFNNDGSCVASLSGKIPLVWFQTRDLSRMISLLINDLIRELVWVPCQRLKLDFLLLELDVMIFPLKETKEILLKLGIGGVCCTHRRIEPELENVTVTLRR